MNGIFCQVREEDRRGLMAVKRQGEQAKNVCSITVLLEAIFTLFVVFSSFLFQWVKVKGTSYEIDSRFLEAIFLIIYPICRMLGKGESDSRAFHATFKNAIARAFHL